MPSRNISLAVLEEDEAEFRKTRDKLLISKQQEAARRQVKVWDTVV